jgi:hypothetical protein
MIEIIRCQECNEIICVKTDNGIVVGNVIVPELSGKCGCGKEFTVKHDRR